MGLGGGVVMIPLMVSVMKTSQHKAHGTSLLALVFTGITGAITYGLKGEVDVIGALILAISAMVTARAGAKFAHRLPEWKLKRSFGGFLIFASSVLLIKPYLHLANLHTLLLSFNLKIAVLLFIGIFTGFFAGMMGIGGGTITVPGLVVMLGYGQHIAQGTSLLCMVPAGAVGAYTHLRLGNVVKAFLPGLVAGIIAGTALGGKTALMLPEANLRILFAGIVCWTGIKFLRTPRPVIC